MPQPWTLLPPITPAPALTAAVGGHALVAQLLAQRGFETLEKARAFLDPAHYTPAPPSALLGVSEAAQLIHDAIQAGQNILVWGDFDVDGQTSTSLLVAALHKLAGVERVRFHVPNRFTESHGILPAKLAAELEDPTFRPHLLLTCDTGIAEAAAIGYAKDQGLTVVVTDHHDLTPEFQQVQPGRDPVWGLPARQVGQASVRRADAIVNPKLQPPGDPLRTLPGVGVAYKLVQQLFALFERSGQEAELLDLVALGIVADVAEQVHDARYLLQMGLEKLRTTKRIGLLALMEIARLNPATVDAESIGFQLGPRMNALGRLEDATVAVELLTTRDVIRASQLAGKMERLNQERRLLTSQITTAAMEMVERDPKLLDYNGLVLAHPNWHAGVVGIVASRLAEEFGKPTVLLLNPPGQAARGSARSVAGVDIGGAIAACSQMLIGHGGHPGAAGLSLAPENIDRFRRELDRQIVLHRDDRAPTGLLIDAEVTLSQLNLPLAEALRLLAPFGQGNPTPQFLGRNLSVVEDRRIGREGTHRRLVVQSADGVKAPVIWFHGADAELPAGPLDLVYTLNINEYKGERTIQLGYIASRAAEVETLTVGAPTSTFWQIHDWRNQELISPNLPSAEVSNWYAEGTRLESESPAVPFAPRGTLAAAEKGLPLVLWSAPPSPQILHWLIETTQPNAIHLCGQGSSDDSLDSVVKQIASLCKYALARDGLLNIGRMAARLGTTEAVVRHGLLWLEHRGMIKLVAFDPAGAPADSVQVVAGSGQRQDDQANLIQAELEEELAEVRAYRRFFLRAKVSELGIGSPGK